MATVSTRDVEAFWGYGLQLPGEDRPPSVYLWGGAQYLFFSVVGHVSVWRRFVQLIHGYFKWLSRAKKDLSSLACTPSLVSHMAVAPLQTIGRPGQKIWPWLGIIYPPKELYSLQVYQTWLCTSLYHYAVQRTQYTKTNTWITKIYALEREIIIPVIPMYVFMCWPQVINTSARNSAVWRKAAKSWVWPWVLLKLNSEQPWEFET